MSHAPHTQTELTVLDMIEHSPVGAVPHTPTYQDALRKLHATHQVYSSADFKDGHVTARSLSKLPLFYANNLDALVAGQVDASALESNDRIFDRYVQSLAEALRAKAESQRLRVVGRPIQHRKHHGPGEAPAVHDPVHSIFLVPGTGPHPGLSGNYLYGSLHEVIHAGAPSTWTVGLHDSDDGSSSLNAAALPEALATLQDVIASAPFELSELAALGFKSN
ncbi:MAG: hypothetical protein H7Y06_13950 [Opitutaceae bacterium]|nr:hypothetical protein [Opitutaceae bacterium]